MTCDIFEFDTGQTNILGLCYLLGKTYKQPTVAPLKSLKLTHSTKLLQLLRRTTRCKQSLRLKYIMIKLNPGFHMIATIAVIAAIMRKKRLLDHNDNMKPFSSDLSYNNR